VRPPQERIRVLHCLSWIAGGGVERRRLMLARLLDPERYEQRLLVRSSNGTLSAAIRAAGTSIVEIGDGRLFKPAVLARAVKVARDFRPHIVHGAVFEGIGAAVVAGRACGARVVVEETSHATNRSRAGHALFRALAAVSDACVAISPAVGDYLVDVTGVPRAKLTVISNGVFAPAPPSAPRSELRRNLGLPEASLVVGTVCRLNDDSHKRVSDLLRALVQLSDLNVHLLIVGEGPERPAMERLARDLGVDQRAHFVGYRDDVGDAYATMDVFALVSAREGFGLSLAEAMLAHLPVVATAVGGIRDIVVHEQTGILVPPADVDAIAAALRRLLDAPAQRQAFADAGRERAQRLFSAERYARDVDAFYSRLLKR
jgi:L-malate glycosyltransferase